VMIAMEAKKSCRIGPVYWTMAYPKRAAQVLRPAFPDTSPAKRQRVQKSSNLVRNPLAPPNSRELGYRKVHRRVPLPGCGIRMEAKCLLVILKERSFQDARYLRARWHVGLPFAKLIELRDEQLDTMLHRIRAGRHVRRPVTRCPRCGHVGEAAEPDVTVRAMILSLSRLGFAPAEQVKTLEKRWAAYRKQNEARPLRQDGGASGRWSPCVCSFKCAGVTPSRPSSRPPAPSTLRYPHYHSQLAARVLAANQRLGRFSFLWLRSHYAARLPS
jgi:hypothetical protein